MTYAEYLLKARRLAVLQCLAVSPGYRVNSDILETALDAGGYPATHDQVIATLAWLGDMGLVSLETLSGHGETLMVATLTVSGLETSRGRRLVPGVRKPLPGDIWPV